MKRFQRTWALIMLVAILGSVALTGCGGTKEAPKGTSNSDKPYAGTTMRFLAANHPWTETLKTMIPDFEAKTGIKVQMESITENQLTQKLTVELTSGAGTVDVFMQRPLQEAKLFDKNGWYTDLTTYMNDAKKTPAEYGASDYFQGPMQTETVNGHLTGVPIVTEQEIVYYRKDLFQAANLKAPKTIADLEAAAKKLNNPDKGIYGIVMRGKGNPAVTQFSSFLYSEGGNFIENGKFVLDSPAATKAVTEYGNLLKNYGPPGVLNMEWPQAAAIFAQGKAAMWVDANSLYKNVTAPDKSTIGDKVGFAMFPAGDKGALPYSVTSWGLSIAKSSKNQDAAWEFLKWATSKEVTTKIQSTGVPSARTSVWESDEGKKAWPADWVSVALESGKVGSPADRPLVINVGKARDLVGNIITAAITGKDVVAAAKTNNDALNQLLTEEAK